MKTGNLKSQTERRKHLIAFCLGLSTNLLIDMLSQAGLDYQRDVSTLRSRTLSEGLGFLTKTLPSVGKCIYRSLKGNRLSIPQFKNMRGQAYPHFLKGMFSLIYDSEGEVREDADICAITDLVQFCFLFYKLEVPYDSKTEGKVLDKFAAVDASLPDDYSHLGSADTRLEPNILEVARSLIQRVVHKFIPQDICPQHGPGAVATGERPHEKMQFKRIYRSAETHFPASEYYFLNAKHLYDEFDSQYANLERVDEPTAKVALVPKDSRGPRLISAEPLEIQFLQQGLGRKLVARIESHPLTSGHVNFTSQDVNRRLALLGSVDGKWVTLDLSDASDRVSLALVRELFAGTGLFPYLRALRSAETILPDGRVIRLRKFAPMGSALCFPIEALCFWALAVACIHVVGDVGLETALSSVYVYGDDIIIRQGFEEHLLQYFHYFSLRLGRDKCCYTGLFRESCGIDAYRGHIITPIKIKRLPITRRHAARNTCRKPSTIPQIDGAAFASWVSISNLLFQKGYYRAAAFTQKHVERTLGTVLPYSMRNPQRNNLNPWEAFTDRKERPKLDDEPIIISDSAPVWYVRQAPSLEDVKLLMPALSYRYNKELQRPEFRTFVIKPVSIKVRKGFSDRSELYRHFIAGLRARAYRYTWLRRVKLQRRWTSIAY